jgi:hypothetical protein
MIEYFTLPDGRVLTVIIPFTGIELPSGTFLTFAPHKDCPCRDCQEWRETWRRLQ